MSIMDASLNVEPRSLKMRGWLGGTFSSVGYLMISVTKGGIDAYSLFMGVKSQRNSVNLQEESFTQLRGAFLKI
ncbi:hypothetical protein HGI81_02225 [Olsenella sp. KGMB02461]|nr:hypothetical protein [Olsenella sp. KGMB02461]